MARSELSPQPWDARGSANPSRRPIEAFAVIALLLIVAVGAWLGQREGPRPVIPAPSAAAEGDPKVIDRGSLVVPPVGPFPAGLDTTVGGIPFSFARPITGWEEQGFSITRSIVGPQGAEAIVFWADYPDERARPCARVLGRGVGASAADLANAMASAPGTALVDGPSDVLVGGRAAQHIELIVRRDAGCDPGYFFRWPHDECWGACWLEVGVGYRIHVWIVEAADAPIVFEAAMSTQGDADLELDIRRIIRSVRFDV